MNKIFVKRYDSDRGEIIAMCDEELVGKEFKEGKKKLDLRKYAAFYKGELLDKDEIKINADKIYSGNIVGERAVGIFVDIGVVGKDDVKQISGIKFIQIYKMTK